MIIFVISWLALIELFRQADVSKFKTFHQDNSTDFFAFHIQQISIICVKSQKLLTMVCLIVYTDEFFFDIIQSASRNGPHCYLEGAYMLSAFFCHSMKTLISFFEQAGSLY